MIVNVFYDKKMDKITFILYNTLIINKLRIYYKKLSFMEPDQAAENAPCGNLRAKFRNIF